MADRTVGSVVSTVINETVDFAKEQVLFFGKAVGKTDGLDKVMRVAVAIIDIVGITLGKSAEAQQFRGRIKNLRDLYTVCQVLFRIQEWTGTPERTACWDNSKGKADSYLAMASKAIYGVGQTLEAIKILGTWNLIDLVAFSEKIVNGTSLQNLKGLPIITMVYDILYATSASILAVDCFYNWIKNKGRIKKAEFKKEKWEQGAQLFNRAFPKDGTPRNLEARTKLLANYEHKICFNQLRMQSTILTYTLASKFNKALPDDQRLEMQEADSLERLLHGGRALLTTLEQSQNGRVNVIEMLKDIDFFITRVQNMEGTDPALRQLCLAISNQIFALNAKLAVKENVNRNQLPAQQSLAQISALFAKINREQRIYDALQKGSEDISHYFEWKCYKWSHEYMTIDLKQRKTFSLLMDMSLKTIGGFFSIWCHFHPIGKAFGSAVIPVMTAALREQEFFRECIKTTLGSIGGLYAYYAFQEVDELEEKIKKLNEAYRHKDAEQKNIKPAMVSLKPLATPQTGDGEALNPGRPIVERDELKAQIVEIVELSKKIKCDRFEEDSLVLKRGMLAAAAA